LPTMHILFIIDVEKKWRRPPYYPYTHQHSFSRLSFPAVSLDS
jgi:hypothetical protein